MGGFLSSRTAIASRMAKDKRKRLSRQASIRLDQFGLDVEPSEIEQAKQKVTNAITVLTMRQSSLLSEIDATRSLRVEIDRNIIAFQEKFEPGPKNKLNLSAAKSQWKLNVLQLKAKVTDNMIRKISLIFLIVSQRLETLKKLPADKEILERDGSDVLTAISKDSIIEQLNEDNTRLYEEIRKIEETNTTPRTPVDESNQDLIQAKELLQASKLMDERATQGYSKIEKIIRNPSSNEGYNINRYINKYLEGAPDLPGVWDFIYAVRDQLLKKVPETTEEQVESSLENYILPILHNKMMNDLNMQEQDEFVLSQCKKYSFTTQDQFNINPDFKDPSLVPYVKAIAELRSIYFQFSPTKKMSAILRAAGAVYEVTGQLQPKVKMGGDDFIDIWVYVVLHAQLRNLPSTTQYISLYASEDLMTSEMGYYFTSLEVALNFIEKLTNEKLKESPSAQITQRGFIVSEKERYRLFCSVDKNFDLAKDNVLLSGYRLYAIEQWVAQPGRFYCTFLQHTKDPKDTVKVLVVKSNDNISPAQQTFVHDTFFTDKPAEYLTTHETRYGTILCSNNPPDESLGSHIFLSSGDFDQEASIVKMIVALKQLGFVDVKSTPPYLPEEQKQQFTQKFAIKVQDNEEFPDMVVQFIKDIQVALKHLNHFPYLCVIDGILSPVLIKSIQLFQQLYNESTEVRYDGQHTFASTMNFRGSKKNEERPASLATDGSLTADTWDCIKYRVICLKDALFDLGFQGVNDPFREHQKFVELIKEFQDSVKILPDGLLSQKTVLALIEKWNHREKENNFLLKSSK